ncbi:metallophosphoesterase [Thiomonas delicata]|uniref:Metallophosphoesterase n=1 Tax=Thiomonas delicata TaxID=364030 RepID=A0A238D1P0_THIDL|nr:metallophosphoesterase [Thiomonas delicata]SBP87149.1 Metallophosphoesterase [Thiomonas delicata]
MRIQLASDLHLEFLAQLFPGETTLAPAPGADVLVLAGDIGNGRLATTLFANWPVPVVYVAGNHEFYGRDWMATRHALRDAARGTAVHVLDNSAVVLGGVRFLGSTLWTDYRYPCALGQRELMDLAGISLNDHRRILVDDGLFTPEMALQEHLRSRAWLQEQLALPHAGKTVVVTHHGPSLLSVHPRYSANPINAAFVSDLGELVRGVPLWLHGHVHDSFDYGLNGCRVVANPRGYPRNRGEVPSMGALVFENPAYQPACVITV